MRAVALAMVAALAAGGCAARPDAPAMPAAVAGNWRGVATADDRTRLRAWRTVWMRALAAADTGGYRADIAAEGILLQPDAALPGAALPAGDYRCRVIKLGSRGPSGRAYVAYPAFRCRVEGNRFTKLTGSQRPVGTIHADSDARRVFLGTMLLGDETLPVRYGRDRERDLAGVVERIGPARWRIVFPYPHFESLLDVIELVPADR